MPHRTMNTPMTEPNALSSRPMARTVRDAQTRRKLMIRFVFFPSMKYPRSVFPRP